MFGACFPNLVLKSPIGRQGSAAHFFCRRHIRRRDPPPRTLRSLHKQDLLVRSLLIFHFYKLVQVNMAQAQGQTMAPTAAPPPVPGPYQAQSDDEDEWFNQPITRRPVASTATKKPADDGDDDIYEDSFTNSWDHQPESGPLIVPSVVVSPNSPSTSTAELPHAFDAAMAISQPTPAPGTTSMVGNDVPLPAKTAPPLVPTDLPPGYTPPPEGSSLGRSMTDTSDTSLPPYETATTASSTSPKTAPGFHPTRVLQIETAGIGMIRIPVLPPRADPVPIRVVSETGELGDAVYSSVQASRTSGSCVLVNATTGAPVCTTTYAPGPVRPPKLRLILNSSDKVITPKEASFVLKIKPPSTRKLSP